MYRTLAIVPARGGSKGIKNKNILPINGKPLIQYTIDPLLDCLNNGVIDRAIVSTDSEEIASICQSLGIDVPFLRPESISGDKAKSIEFVIHTLEFFEQKGELYDAVMILQPTAPQRVASDIKSSLEIFDPQENESLISCYQEDYINDLTMYFKEGNQAVPLNPNHNKAIRRQDHKVHYVRNGAIYITSSDYLRKEEQIISDNPLMHVMPKSRSANIDTIEDLILFEKTL